MSTAGGSPWRVATQPFPAERGMVNPNLLRGYPCSLGPPAQQQG
jgi:hypothetical protein